MQMRQRMRGGCAICNSAARRSRFPVSYKTLTLPTKRVG
ncbi:hypothetical protein [Klebsiella pneumoniae]|nr:hypothetical protein [Klebsiella pneumoniae]